MPPLDERIPTRLFIKTGDKLVHDAHLVPPIDPRFLEDLESQEYQVHRHHEFEFPGMPEFAKGKTPLLYADVYKRRPTELESPDINPNLRNQLLRDGARLENIMATSVVEHYQGGQKGRNILRILLYPNLGPFVVCLSTGDANSVLQSVASKYVEMFGNGYDEGHWGEGVTETMGTMNSEGYLSPIGFLSFPQTEAKLARIGLYLPDAQAVVDARGQLLPYMIDGKNRAAVHWKNLVLT